MRHFFESGFRRLKKKEKVKRIKRQVEAATLHDLVSIVRGRRQSSKTEIAAALGKFTAPYKVNLCSGPCPVPGYVNCDVFFDADIRLDLEKSLIPLPDRSAETVVCMSAINYFTRERAQKIIQDVWRVLKPGGVARFGVQDLRILAQKYLEGDKAFYCRLMEDGRIRFPGETFADKFMHFSFGFGVPGMKAKHSKYIFDFETLSLLFQRAGFRLVEPKPYQESRIPEVKQIDNRPEQMFFLEAVKDDVNQLAREAEQWEEKGDLERAWQIWIHCLSVDPTFPLAFEKIRAKIRERESHRDLIVLAQEILQHAPAHMGALRLLDETKAFSAPEPARTNAQNAPPEPTAAAKATDEQALKMAIDWIQRAQDVMPDDGVSAEYLFNSATWTESFPETTGYIIPTILAQYALTKDERLLARAKRMADWLLNVQKPMGDVGEPVGIYAPRSRVFNNGQVLLGLVAIYKVTSEKKYLEAAQRLAHHIVLCQDDDGAYRLLHGASPRSYDVRCSWALLELHAVQPDSMWFEAALRHIDWVMRQCAPSGWFWENSFDKPTYPITHLTAYTHVGLLECYRILSTPENKAEFDYSWMLDPLRVAADSICEWYQQNGSSKLPGRFTPDWKSKEEWSCNTGTAQYSYFFRRMASVCQEPRYAKMADQLLNEVKALQLSGAGVNEDMRGGLWGSRPAAGEYSPLGIPNWGVKFFADALITKLVGPERFSCLG